MRTLNDYPSTGLMEFPPEQAIAEEAVEQSVYALQALWVTSLDAEQAGDITLALEIHERILAEVGRSYAAYLRAGWLHSRAGGYIKSLEFYEKAVRCSPGAVAPLFGAMGCYVAMGDTVNASRMVKAIIDLDAFSDASSVQLVELHASGDFHALPPFSHRIVDRFELLGHTPVSGAA